MGKVAVVVGAGPVGALAAIELANRGFDDVQVFEKRPSPSRKPAPGDTQAYQISINTRGIRALKQAGVDVAPLAALHNGRLEHIFYDSKGRAAMRHSVEITPHGSTTLRVFRDELAWLLVAEARRLHPDKIHFSFGTAVEGVDFEERTLELAARGKTTRQVGYDLLVAADGAGSVVRRALAQRLGPTFVERVKHGVVYTGAAPGLPSGPYSSTAAEWHGVSYDGRATGEFPNHGFFHTHFFSAGAVIASGYADAHTRLILFLNAQGAERLQRGEVEWLQERLQKEMPALPPGVKAAIQELLLTRPGLHSMAGWTTLSQLHGPQVALVGDAAHTVTPVQGQGCNAGLEDVALLVGALDEQGGDVSKALPAYTAARLPDVRALVAMNMIAAGQRAAVQRTGAALQHQIWLAFHGLLLRAHLAIHNRLHKLAPHAFARPAFTRAVLGQLPYREGMRGLYWDLMALLALLAAVALPLLARSRSRD